MTFPYPTFTIQFTKDGTAFEPSETQMLLQYISAAETAPTDLIFMSHGWNNNVDDAKNLYESLSGLIKQQVDTSVQLAKRSYAVCGVLWPSKKFEDEDLIPSGAAALNSAVTVEHLKQRVDDLRSLYAAAEWPSVASSPPPKFQQLEHLMEVLEFDPEAQATAVQIVRGLLSQHAASTDDASARFFELTPESLVTKLSKQLNPPPIQAGSGAAALANLDPFHTGQVSGLGGAAGFRDVLGGIKSGFMHLLNYTTYYVMKARAGDVGIKGVAPIITAVRDQRPSLRIHMLGHSFGCRVTAAAVNSLTSKELYRPDTILLLQGAFSHNGFANPGQADRGVFRDVIKNKKVRGPVLISHTRNDKAVGIAYPIASRISGVTAAALGDANDIFGGLGSNGTQTPQTTPEAVYLALLDVGKSYSFTSGVPPSTPYNLKADAFIKGHSDIRKPEVAFAFTAGMAAPILSG